MFFASFDSRARSTVRQDAGIGRILWRISIALCNIFTLRNWLPRKTRTSKPSASAVVSGLRAPVGAGMMA
ncbi:hypothetical protein [Nonomuraea sp. 10N515B]|uniref:hypothetical protein n=1 Tax=Nonomuraea sp. 10N515B TaxID=3457422 RepID=UPI003FCC5DAF